MTNSPARPPRPERPARAAQSRDLTRGRIIQAGIELLDRDGVDALTMRGVAKALGVTPMALYNHVSGKNDLLRAIAAHILDKTEFDGREPEWRAQVEFCFREFRSICLRHPGLPRLLETDGVAPATVFAPMELTLEALERTGMTGIDGLRTYFTLVSFTLGQASYQSRGPYPDLVPSRRIHAGRIAGQGYGAIEQMSLPLKWDFDAAFEFGLRLILDGVEAAVSTAR